MTRAYDETYLDDAMNNLGDMLDYAVNDCAYDGDAFMGHFIISGVAGAFGRGNPKYVVGLSGPELASEVIRRTLKTRPAAEPSDDSDKSAEYWAGWALAYYQWHSARRFGEMFDGGLTLARMLSLYPALHEADISKFVTVADGIVGQNKTANCNLRRIRRAAGFTQKGLSQASGVSLRMIQLYEQRGQDVNKAQADHVAALARALGCAAEDLLEAELA